MDAAGPDSMVADLLTVLEVSRELATTTDLPRLLERVADAALRVLDCERASVFLHDPAGDELYSLVATGAREVRFPADRGIAGEAFRTGRLINVPDAYEDARFHPEVDRLTGFRTRNLLTCPLIDAANVPVGVLQLLNKRQCGFTERDEILARTFTAQAGVAIQRQRLLDAFAEKERIERDLELARKIQQALLPKRPPRLPGFDVAGWNKPADRTGGDFYDFVATDRGDLVIVLADVAGHGIGPALVVAECRALIRSALTQADRADEVIAHVNRFLADDLPPDRFVTAFLAILRRDTGILEYLSAGHGPVLFYEHATGTIRELSAQGPPLAVLADFPYTVESLGPFRPGDLLAAFTDGFFEWTDAAGEAFGVERLKDQIRRDHGRPAAEIVDGFYRAVLGFVDGRPQPDDLTALVVKRVPPA